MTITIPSRPHPARHRTSRILDCRLGGFTLLETLIAVSILGVLAAFALPALNAMLRNGRMTAQTNDFIGSLSYARSEAIKRGIVVSLCPSTDGATCTTDTTITWDSGWLIITGPTIANPPNILRVHEVFAGVSHNTLASDPANNFRSSIAFLPSGRVNLTFGTYSGYFVLSDTVTKQNINICITQGGRFRPVGPATAPTC